MRQNRIQEEWIGYRNTVIPANASSVQLQECRRAFYGGVHAMFQRVLKELGPTEGPDEPDINMLGEIQAELDDFNERVQRGLA